MRRHITKYFALSLLGVSILFLLPAVSAPQQSKTKTAKGGAASYGNADSISDEELKIYEYFLASDQLEGRNFPSRGYDAAALYVASHLAEWGLKPVASRAGTNGPLQPYFMPIELVSRSVVVAESKASLSAPALAGRGGPAAAGGAPAGAAGGRGGEAAAAPQLRTTDFEYTKDWTTSAVPGTIGGLSALASFEVSGNVVFAGHGFVINKTNTNPYEGLDVRGKIIVVAGLPPEIANAQPPGGGRGGRGGAFLDLTPLGKNCTDYLTPAEYAAKNGAVAVVTVANFQQLAAMNGPNPFGGGGGGRGGPSLNGPAFQVAKFQQPLACESAPSISAGVNLTNAIFQGEKLSGSQVFYGGGANAKLESFALSEQKKLSLHVSVHSEPGHGENVVGMLEGSDPALKNEYVVMSAHLDHIGFSAPLPDGHNVNNGADDDGSGSCALLAIARAYAQGAAKGMRPKRSIIFLWNAGEEKGLWGSQYFTEFPPIDLTKVVANLNMDMIGRTKNANSVDTNATHVLVKPGEVFIIGPNVSSDDMEAVIETVNNNYQELSLNHFYDTTAPDATHDNLGPPPNGQRILYRSDHYNFAKMGIPIAFFTDGLHVDYHRPTDTPEKIDYKAMQQIAKTVAAVGWVLGNQAGRPKLKDKLPEQLVRDMKNVQDQGWGKITPVLPPVAGEPF